MSTGSLVIINNGGVSSYILDDCITSPPSRKDPYMRSSFNPIFTSGNHSFSLHETKDGTIQYPSKELNDYLVGTIDSSKK